MEVLFQLAILLATAKILGEICERVSLPSVLGYISTGIVYGFLFNNYGPLMGLTEPLAKPSDPVLFFFAQLGAILLLFTTGFREGDIHKLLGQKRAIVTISILGYAFPFITTFLIGSYFGLPFGQLLVLMLVVSATDIGTTVKTLIDLHEVTTKIGRTLLGVTIIDGFIGLIMFTFVITFITTSQVGWSEVMLVASSMFLFLVIFIIMQKVAPKIIDKTGTLAIEEAQFAFAFIFILFLAIIAESFGLHGIIGAFLAGIILSRSSIVETDFIEKLSAVSYAIFVPLFFVWTGLLLNIPSLSIFSGIIIIGVLVSNFLGASLGSFLSGIRDKKDVISVGLGMLPRGGINLVIATIGIKLVSEETGNLILATVMLLIIASIVVAPALLRGILKRERE
jgi:Kef-type K+ transport system membrane component KefB